MFSVFVHYNSKRQFELDITLVRFVQAIWTSLIWLRTYREIKACMDGQKEEFSLVDRRSCLCLIMLSLLLLLLCYVVELCFLKLMWLNYVVVVEEHCDLIEVFFFVFYVFLMNSNSIIQTK